MKQQNMAFDACGHVNAMNDQAKTGSELHGISAGSENAESGPKVPRELNEKEAEQENCGGGGVGNDG